MDILDVSTLMRLWVEATIDKNKRKILYKIWFYHYYMPPISRYISSWWVTWHINIRRITFSKHQERWLCILSFLTTVGYLSSQCQKHMSFSYYGSPTSGVCDLSWLSCLGQFGLLTYFQRFEIYLPSDLLTLSVPDEGYSIST